MSERVKFISGCKAEGSISCSKEDWAAAQKKAFKKVAANVTIKGFRKGQAPEALVRSHVDPNQVINEAINAILPNLYSKFVTEENLRPYKQPKVEITKVSDDGVEAKFTVTLMPKVELGKYKGLHAEKEAPSVSDKEVDEAIAAQMKSAAVLEVADKAAEKGDTVVMDFDGYVDGKQFEGGMAQNYSLELGSNTFVPGFEDALVGVKAGDKKDVEITFPKNYVAELAGKKATFRCKIHEIKVKKVPELNDEAVKDLGIKGIETVDALKNKTKTDLLANKVANAERVWFDAIVGQIVKDSKIDIADEIIDEEAANSEAQLRQRVEQSGLTFDQYLQITGSKLEDLKKSMREQAKKSLEAFLVLQEIGAKEKVAVTKEDTDAEIKKLADQYGMKVEDVEKALASSMAKMSEDIRARKIDDFVKANNN